MLLMVASTFLLTYLLADLNFSKYLVFLCILPACFVVVPIPFIHSILYFTTSYVEKTFMVLYFIAKEWPFSIKRSGYSTQQSSSNYYCLKWCVILNNSKISTFHIQTITSLVHLLTKNNHKHKWRSSITSYQQAELWKIGFKILV